MRILMVGNSLTFANDMPSTLAELTGADVVALTRGGARLSEFANPSTRMGTRVAEQLATSTYDFVVMQDMSHNAATNPQKHVASICQMAQLARDAGATPILYATWAYAPDCPKLEKLGFTASEMHDLMRAGHQQAAQRANVRLADVAAAFASANDSTLYADDGVHPSLAGSRLAAATIAGEILR